MTDVSRVLYFDLDSVRYDHLGCYGYDRNTSPNVDAIAEEGVVFENCFASDTPCLPSRAAMFSCRPGISNGVVSHEWPGINFRFPATDRIVDYHDEYRMPMRVLQEHDYHTVTFSIFQQRHRANWFNTNFTEVRNPRQPTNSEEADSVNPRVLDWMDDNLHELEDAFVHVNYWDAHTSYHPDHDLFEAVRESGDPPAEPDQATIEDHYEHVWGPKTASAHAIRWHTTGYERSEEYDDYMADEITGREDFERFVTGYDASIRTADEALGEVVDYLKAEGVWDETAVIVSADHGEAVGEFGMYFEHGVATDGVAHLPLIVRWPGLTDQPGVAGTRVEDFVYQFDAMATVVDLLTDGDLPGMWEAESRVPALRGEAIDGHEFVVYGCGIFTLQRAVRTDDWAYVHTYHPGCNKVPDEALFDLQADPHQLHDVIDGHPAVADRLRARLFEWRQDWTTGPDAVQDPFDRQVHDFEYFEESEMREFLEFHGREEHLAEFEQQVQTRRRTVAEHPAPESRY